MTRTVLTAEQVNAIVGKLREPYATLVLFLAATGLRIGEALTIKQMDFVDNVLHVTRRIYDGDVDALKSKRSERRLPIDPILMERLEKLGKKRVGVPFAKGHTAEPRQRSKTVHQTRCKGTPHLAWRLA